MAYQEKTTISYGGRLGSALKGIVGGFIAFIGGTILLFWNEGDFIKKLKAINEAEGATTHCESVATIDPALEGKMIHASAFADTKDVLTDGEFGLSETAISLSRTVEYYQWKESSTTETTDKLGGGQEKVTTYTYKQGWVSSPINSGAFKDEDYQSKNFILAKVDPRMQYAQNVSFGAYSLPSFFIRSIGGSVSAEPKLSPEQIEALEKAVIANARTKPAAPAPASTNAPASQWVHASGSTIYLGQAPASPHIGDVRVTFAKVLPKEVSIIGKVKGETFEEYKAKNGKTISGLRIGTVSMEAMYEGQRTTNKAITWILRVIGIFLVCTGLKMIFAIFEALAKVVPFLGTLVGAGVGLVCTVLGIAWSFLWIAIGWLFYRPLIGIPLVIVPIALIIYLKKQASNKPVKETPAQ